MSEAGLWTPEKAAAVEGAFWEFLKHVRINSKEKGGDYSIIDGIYEAQKRHLRTVFGGLADDIHDFKILKSRQLGVTTITRALVIFWLGIHRGMQGAMVFDTTPHLEEARQEIRDMMRMLPESLKFPAIEDDNRYGMRLSNNSRLRFMSAGIRNSRSSGVLGRSSGINLVAASEMCSWENDEGVTSLKNSLSRDYPDRLYIWESTARGPNVWQDMWEEAKEDDLNQRTCFIGWWGKDNQRIRRGTPKWERYGLDAPNEREAKRISLVRDLYDFEVDQEQLAWYRELTDPNRQNDGNDPEDSYLLQDQPWTEDEAFQLTGSTFFDYAKLGEAMRRAASFKFQGFKFWPGSERPNVAPGSGFLECEIMPARTWREVEIRIWEEPQSDAVYVVAADPAFGHSEDSCNSAVEVIRCYADCVEQVAEYTCPSVSTHQFAWVCASLVGYYGALPNSRVLYILELNGPGEAVWREYNSLKQLLTGGYLRARAREKGLADIFSNMRNYIYQRSDAMGPGHNYHWVASTQRKVAIMERLRDYVHSFMLLLRSRDLIEEMRSISRAGDQIGAERGHRDDRVIAMAMAVRAYEEKLRSGLVSGNRTREADIIARRKSPKDMMALYNRNMFDQFFRAKQLARAQREAELAKAAWRYR